MKMRQLMECTLDLAQPAAELVSVISAVLATQPDLEARTAVLRTLDDEIGQALSELESPEADGEGVE